MSVAVIRAVSTKRASCGLIAIGVYSQSEPVTRGLRDCNRAMNREVNAVASFSSIILAVFLKWPGGTPPLAYQLVPYSAAPIPRLIVSWYAPMGLRPRTRHGIVNHGICSRLV